MLDKLLKFCLKIVSNIFGLLKYALLITAIIYMYLDQKEKSEWSEVEHWAVTNKLSLEDIKQVEFKIDFNQTEWDYLVSKLEKTRYFDSIDQKYASRWEFGFDSEYTKDLVDYWKTDFNWSKQVDYLNSKHQYLITINNIKIHYVRIKPRSDKISKRLMLIDGWPGSFFGFYKMIDRLLEIDDSLDIVIPSIPGYGYSTPLNKPVDTIETAQLFDALMRYLYGENCEYYVHGEDWGSAITTDLAQIFPYRVKGIHITLPQVNLLTDPFNLFSYIIGFYIFPNYFLKEQELSEKFYPKYSLAKYLNYWIKLGGYFHLQATTPDTLSQGVTDSPSGLLVYILEKYSRGSFNFENEILGTKDGALNNFNKDDLLTLITFYWMTNSISSSMRYYKISFENYFIKWPNKFLLNSVVSDKVKVGIQYSENEIFMHPHFALVKRYKNLVQYKILENRGHFISFQDPESTANNFAKFISL